MAWSLCKDNDAKTRHLDLAKKHFEEAVELVEASYQARDLHLLVFFHFLADFTNNALEDKKTAVSRLINVISSQKKKDIDGEVFKELIEITNTLVLWGVKLPDGSKTPQELLDAILNIDYTL